MCVNGKFVYNAGKRLYVPCGHCPACQQSKANKRAIRIQNNYPDDGKTVMAMFTLTYDDMFIPYIRKSDLPLAVASDYIDACSLKEFIDYSDEWDTDLELPIYRDFTLRKVPCNKKDYRRTNSRLRFYHKDCRTKFWRYKKVRISRNTKASVDVCTVHDWHSIDYYIKHSLKSDSDKVSVCLYSDLQKFFKRFRINLQRSYGLTFPFSYYACSEHGSKNSRAHFHVLIFFPARYYTQVKLSVIKSWPFDYRLSKRSDFRIATHPAHYVATYVNCHEYVPELLLHSSVKPKQSYSQGFGMAKEHLSLRSIFEKFNRRTYWIDREKQVKNSLAVTPVAIPSYVTSRYAPKCKGYSRLAMDTLYSIAKEPKRLCQYARSLSYVDDDLHKNITMLTNKRNYWLDNGFSADDFALFYSQVWSVDASTRLRLSHQDFDTPGKLLQYYFNIDDYVGKILDTGEVIHQSVYDSMISEKVPLDKLELDPNKFQDTISRNNILLRAYQRRKHQKYVNADKYADAQ